MAFSKTGHVHVPQLAKAGFKAIAQDYIVL